jgi:hypothetical protein
MFTLQQGQFGAICQRRDFLRVGSGLALASFVSPVSALRAASADSPRGGKAKSCILVYLLGGPPQLDTFDLKPEAPAEIRGPFKPIATNVPGTQICEHLPKLAALADRYALVRSVSHPNSNHTPMIYYTLTGRHTEQPLVDNDVRPPQRTDFPHMGAVVSHMRQPRDTPGFVALPELAVRSSTTGEFNRARSPLRGGGAGFLGASFDPLAINGAPGAAASLPYLTLPEGVSAERFQQRMDLLRVIESGRPPAPATEQFQEMRRRAIVLSGAPGAERSQMFSLADEPAATSDRYGRHRFGRSLQLARRLTEAGVPMVAVHFNEMTVCDGWDTHGDNFTALENELLPMLDQSLSALLEDLERRGTLDETLVVCMGEFGRTPKINAQAGRDHWGNCSTTLLAGGGVRGGVLYGSSDRTAAFPKSDSVDPVDLQATMYQVMGLDLDHVIRDQAGRPYTITTGRAIDKLLA